MYQYGETVVTIGRECHAPHSAHLDGYSGMAVFSSPTATIDGPPAEHFWQGCDVAEGRAK